MNWSDLVSTNVYGECAAADVDEIVSRIDAYVRRRGAHLDMERGRFVKQILQYILLRQTASCLEISDPHVTPSVPAGWTEEDEAIWQEWLVYTFPYHTWLTEVMNPVFGQNVRLWEARCEGWRLELAHFLPWWVQRSMDIVRAFDPTQIEPEAEEEAGMDAYLLDHGSSKQRKAALRSGAC